MYIFGSFMGWAGEKVHDYAMVMAFLNNLHQKLGIFSNQNCHKDSIWWFQIHNNVYFIWYQCYSYIYCWCICWKIKDSFQKIYVFETVYLIKLDYWYKFHLNRPD